MKKLVLLSVLIFSIVKLNAQSTENSLLWEISGNNLEQPSYLFGTIHLTCDATLKDKVSKALDSTKLLVLEVDLDDPSLSLTIMKNMNMKDDKTIKDLVTEEDYQALNMFFKNQLGMPLENMQKMKPFFLNAMFYPKFLDCTSQSLEAKLMTVAHEQNEEVKGLESIEDQINIFDEIPYAEQIQELLETTKDSLKTSKEMFNKVLNAYNDENINEMANLIKADTSQTMYRHIDKMLYNRNKNWIPKMQEFMEEQPTFFGVGAGHLAGENGVIDLLKKEGYIVKPIF